jgi:hypothetical protein
MGRNAFVHACQLRRAAIAAIDQHANFLGTVGALITRVKAGDLRPEEIAALEAAVRDATITVDRQRGFVASL